MKFNCFTSALLLVVFAEHATAIAVKQDAVEAYGSAVQSHLQLSQLTATSTTSWLVDPEEDDDQNELAQLGRNNTKSCHKKESENLDKKLKIVKESYKESTDKLDKKKKSLDEFNEKTKKSLETERNDRATKHEKKEAAEAKKRADEIKAKEEKRVKEASEHRKKVESKAKESATLESKRDEFNQKSDQEKH